MFTRLMLALLAILFAVVAFAADGFLLRDGDRVVFYGDSITDTEWYPTLVQTYVLTRYPAWRCSFRNRGQSGDNAGSLARFQRDVVDNNPTLFTFMMGYNDGGYARVSNATLVKFTGNVAASLAKARAANPKIRPVLLSSTPNELAVSADPGWVSHPPYPYALLMLARAEAELAAKEGVPFIDLTTQYGQTMGLGEVMAGPTFLLSRDGVHPQQEGQTFIAYHVLRGLAAPADVAGVTLDAMRGKVVQALRCKVTDVKLADGAISFTRVCEALPYPTPAPARPFAFLVNLDDTLNRDRLVVTGLTKPAYAIKIDDVPIAEVSAEELAAGVNLGAFPTTPMNDQSLRVLDAVRAKDLLDCRFWRTYITTGKADGRGRPLPSTDAETQAAMAKDAQALAEAERACYALNTPQPHTLTLTPLDTPRDRYAALVDTPFNQSFLTVSADPVRMDWSTQALLSPQAQVRINNPGRTARTGSIAWQCPAGWTVNPPQTTFTVEPGKTITVPFNLSMAVGTRAPLPSAEVRWAWSEAWAAPMRDTVILQVLPRFTIPRAAGKVTVDGKFDDWPAVLAFSMDNPYYLDAAVPGKRIMWQGPADSSADVRLQWDAQNLYMAVLVHDNDHLQQAEDSMLWSQDSLQFGTWLQEPGKGEGRYEFGVGAYADGAHIVNYRGATPADPAQQLTAATVVDEKAGTCAYEVAIPWARLAPFQPAGKRVFRWTLTVNDADRVLGKGYNYLSLTPGIAYGKSFDGYAEVVLGD